MADDRWEPTPVPLGDGRHDIGDEMRLAIYRRLQDDWSRDPDLSPEKVRRLAQWAAASVRALFHELGTLREMSDPRAEADAQTIQRQATESAALREELRAVRARTDAQGPCTLCRVERDRARKEVADLCARLAARQQDDERLRQAAARVGLTETGCDTADWLAEEILTLRARLAAQERRD